MEEVNTWIEPLREQRMELKPHDAWLRHQLAATERMQAEIGRDTRPVMTIADTNSSSYVMTWRPLCVLWSEANMPWLPPLVAALPACIIALTAPTVALAVGTES